MIKDVIRVVNNFKQVKSPNLKKFITGYVTEKDVIQSGDGASYISLQSLRNTYTTDRALFFRLVKEFALRGFQVLAENNSTIFYKNIVAFDDETGDKLERVSSDENLKISELIFPGSVQEFLTESNIQDNDFFSGIILENIKQVFPGVEDTLLILLNKLGIQQVEKSDEKSLEATPTNNQFMPIEQLFDSQSDHLIVNAFYANDVRNVGEVTHDKLDKILKFKGIGEKKRKRIMGVLESTEQIDKELGSQAEHEYVDIFPELLINDVDAREAFRQAKVNTIPIQLPLDSELIKEVLVENLGHKRVAKLRKMAQRIYLDVNNYLNWINSDNEGESLNETDTLRILRALKVSDELKEWSSINNSEEFNRELTFEFYQGLNLDKVAVAVRKQITDKISNSESMEKIARFRKEEPKATLQSIGDKSGLTKERVRQIEKKIAQVKKMGIADYRLSAAFKLNEIKKKQRFVFWREVPENLLPLIKLDPTLIVGKLPLLVIDRDDKLLLKLKELDEYLENNDEVNFAKMWSYLLDLNDDSRSIDKDEIVTDIYERYGFMFRVGDELFKKFDKYYLAFKIILNEYGQQFDVHELDVTQIEQQFLNITGRVLFQESIKLDKKRLLNNALVRIADKDENIKYIGNWKYKVGTDTDIPEALFTEIVSFINKSLQVVPSIKTNKVFNHFKTEMENVGISSSRELYFSIREVAGERFDYSSGNDLSIWRKGAEKDSNGELLIELTKQHGGSIEQQKVIAELGWGETSVMQVVDRVPGLVSYDNSIWYVDTNVNGDVKQFIKQNIMAQESQHPGYIFPNYIVNNLTKRMDLIAKLPDVKLARNVNLFVALLEAIDPRWKGFPQFLYSQNRVAMSEILRDEFGDHPFERQQLVDFLTEIGYSGSGIYQHIKKLITESSMTEIASNRYILTTALKLEEVDTRKIDTYLEDLLINRQYYSLYDELINSTKLPNIQGLTWTKELLGYFARNSAQVKMLPWSLDKSVSASQLSDPLIIVKRSNKLSTLVALVYELLLQYKGNMSQRYVREYLCKKRILVGRSSSNLLPIILNSIWTIDNYQTVHLKPESEVQIDG